MVKPILVLDFDGVLNSYSSGWKGADIISDPPVDGAIAFLVRAVQHFTVNIFSSRSHQVGGRIAMMKWLAEHLARHLAGLPPDAEIDAPSVAQAAGWIATWLVFPIEKPSAMVTLDDRAITFTGTWPEMETLLAFKPWNRK